jgi:ankyrin repeat protein
MAHFKNADEDTFIRAIFDEEDKEKMMRTLNRVLRRGLMDINHPHPRWDVTPIHAAIIREEWDLLPFLVENGAKVQGQYLLHSAAQMDTGYQGIPWLLEQGIPLEGKSINGQTALHDASECSNHRNIRCLLLAGADMNARDDNGQRPIDWAHELDIIDAFHVYEERLAIVVALDRHLPTDMIRAVCHAAVHTLFI